MRQETARKLLLLVNNPEAFEALIDYVKERVGHNWSAMEFAQTPDEWKKAQGALSELRVFQDRFREVVLDKAK